MKYKFLVMLHLCCVVMPQKIKVAIYRKTMHAEIGAGARIGVSFIHARKLVLKENSSIGHFNVLRNIERLELGEDAKIGNRNYATSLPLGSTRHFSQCKDRFPALILKDRARVTGKHYFDCNDQISIGEFSLIAGHSTSILTHGVSIIENRQHCAPVTIGNYCMVGARSMVVKGAALPDFSVLGAQSVLVKKQAKTHTLYAGNPAMPVRELRADAKFFSRTKAHVD